MAASCPDGNAEVGRFVSRCVTSGRGRFTTAAAARNAPSSPNITTATNAAGRQCRVMARKATQVTMATMRIAWVAPSVLKSPLQGVRDDVRWAANQCGMV